MKISTQRGFTLIELAIVLVIIGFIVAAVIGGQSLVRSARVNAVVTEVEGFRSAVELFRQTYLSWPGDMIDAATYWTSCTDVAGNDCNGDGDGTIEFAGGDATAAEDLRLWQHLNLANILQGSYTGEDAASGNDLQANVNVPKAEIELGAYNIRDDQSNGTNRIIIAGEGGNTLQESVLSPQEAEGLDYKMDDGDAGSGDVRGANGNGTTSCLSSGEYDLSQVDIYCIMYFEVD